MRPWTQGCSIGGPIPDRRCSSCGVAFPDLDSPEDARIVFFGTAEQVRHQRFPLAPLCLACATQRSLRLRAAQPPDAPRLALYVCRTYWPDGEGHRASTPTRIEWFGPEPPP